MAARKRKGETTETPPEETADRPKQSSEKIIQIVGDADALYGLDGAGRVFVYVDDSKRNEHGWYQLDYDETRSTEEENIGKTQQSTAMKFVQISGNADGLYALDESGRTYLYHDVDDSGWFQLEFDDEPHELAPPVED